MEYLEIFWDVFLQFVPVFALLLVVAIATFWLRRRLPALLRLKPPYRRRDYLLTVNERALFGLLTEALERRYYVFPKVRMADVLALPSGISNRKAHARRIEGRRVDFLVCDRGAVQPLLAIEFDGAPSNDAGRSSRDRFVEAAFDAAELPLLHLSSRVEYSPGELGEMVANAIGDRKGAPAA